MVAGGLDSLDDELIQLSSRGMLLSLTSFPLPSQLVRIELTEWAMRSPRCLFGAAGRKVRAPQDRVVGNTDRS